jgi:hypothetical protein
LKTNKSAIAENGSFSILRDLTSIVGIWTRRIHGRRGGIDRLSERRLAYPVTFGRHALGIDGVIT